MEREATAGAFRALFRWIRPHRWAFVGSVVLGATAGLMEVFSIGLVVPFLLASGKGLDPATLGPFQRVLPLLRDLGADGQRAVLGGLILGGFVFRGLAWWGAAVLRERMASSVHAAARRRIFARWARAPIAWVETRPPGEGDALLTHESDRLALSSATCSLLAMSAAMVLAYLSFLVYLAPLLTAVAFLFLALTALAIRLLRRPIEKSAIAMREEARKRAGEMRETLASVHLLQALGRTEEAVDRFDAANRRYLAAERRQKHALDAIPPLSELLGAVVILAVLWLGSRVLPIRGGADPLLLTPYLVVLYRLLPRFLAVLTSRAQLSTSLPSIPPIERFLSDPAAEPIPHGNRVPPASPPRVVFEDVHYRHRDGVPDVVAGLSVVLEPGRVTALVGPSGSGKSTAVDLLLGLRRPSAGRILVDGEDLSSYSGDLWRRTIGVVPQEPRLFDGSVRDNLLLAAPAADDARVRAALEEASAAFVRSLPQGLDTPVGERGARLSGGERQRLCLARALISDPTLLVLDEPTSQLDAENERAVAAAVVRAAKGRTTLVVAHRLSTVRAADRIVLLSRGRVVETGSHDELMARGGEYARLVRMGLDDLGREDAGTGAGERAK